MLQVKERVNSIHGWDKAVSEVVSAVEFTHVESDWYEAYNSFNAIRGRCSKSISDLKGCIALHFFKFVDIFNNRGTFEEPEVKSV